RNTSDELHASRRGEDRSAADPGLRGMPEDGRSLAALAPLPHLRPRRLLRRLEEQARHEALPRDPAPDHHLARAGRGLELVLCGRGRHGARVSTPFSPSWEARREQMFPVLDPDEIAHMARFGTPRRFADGERVMQTGKATPGSYLVVSGRIRVTGRDAHGHDFPVVEHGPGNFSGELAQLSGKPSFVDGVAVG